MRVKKKFAWLGLGLACVACCAPLVVASLGGAGLAAFAALSADIWICSAVLVVLGLGSYWFARYRRANVTCATTGANACSPGCSCKSQ
jgi:hypothetical protein